MAMKSVVILGFVLVLVLLVFQDVAYARELTETNALRESMKPAGGPRLRDEKQVTAGGFGNAGGFIGGGFGNPGPYIGGYGGGYPPFGYPGYVPFPFYFGGYGFPPFGINGGFATGGGSVPGN